MSGMATAMSASLAASTTARSAMTAATAGSRGLKVVGNKQLFSLRAGNFLANVKSYEYVLSHMKKDPRNLLSNLTI